jgi:hypothetical protein
MKIFEITLSEETTGKLIDVKPGAEATIDMGDGTKTVVDLKKNPTALVKSPDGKTMFNKAGITSSGVQTSAPDPASMMKPGEPVFITSQTTEDDEPGKKVIRGPHGRLNVDRSKKGVTRVTRRGWRTDEPEREKNVGRGRPVGSTGYTPGVGVAQPGSFGDVPTDVKANRKRPRLDYDDKEILETDPDRRKFLGLGAAGALASLGTGAGLGHLYVSNELEKQRSFLEKQKRKADNFMDLAEFSLESKNIKAACRYFERAHKVYSEAGMTKHAREVEALIATCRARGF